MGTCIHREIPDHIFAGDGLSVVTFLEVFTAVIRTPPCGQPTVGSLWCPVHTLLHRARHTEYEVLGDYNRDHPQTSFAMDRIADGVEKLPRIIWSTDLELVWRLNALRREFEECDATLRQTLPLNFRIGMGEHKLRLRHSAVFFQMIIDGDPLEGHLGEIRKSPARDIPSRIRILDWDNMRNRINSIRVVRRSPRITPPTSSWGNSQPQVTGRGW